MSQPAQKYDIIIIGGGFAGLMTAISLAPLNLTILLVDKNSCATKNSDARAIALNHGSQRWLTRQQLWPLLIAHATPIKHVHISEKGRFNKVRFHASEQGVEALGYVINGQQLLDAMKSFAADYSSITCLNEAELGQLDHQQRTATIQQSGKTFDYHYRLLIAADGSHSVTRQQLGIKAQHKTIDYQALLSCISLQQPHQHTAYERFTDEGTIALLPLARQQCKLVITGDKNQITTWQSYSEEKFLQQLQKMFSYFVGPFSTMTPTICYPLQYLTVEQQVIDGALLIGNAAHTFSPLAAQGLNLALADIAYLTETVSQAINHHEDFSSLNVLQRYLKTRRTNQQFIQQFTQKLGDIFASSNPIVRCGRKFSLAACQLSPLLHNSLAKRLMG